MSHYRLYVTTEETQFTLEIYSDHLRLLTMDTTLNLQNVFGLQIHRLGEIAQSLYTVGDPQFDKVAASIYKVIQQRKNPSLHHAVYYIRYICDSQDTLIESGN